MKVQSLLDSDEYQNASRNRSNMVMEWIKRYIIEHALVPGDPIPSESVIRKELNVSRSSIREALSKLEVLDITASRKGAGSVVGSLSLQPMVETLLMRSALGQSGIETLAEIVQLRCLTDQSLGTEVLVAFKEKSHQNLRALVERMREKAAVGQRYQREDMEFHMTLVSNIQNAVAQQLVGALWVVHTESFNSLYTRLSQEFINLHLMDAAGAHERILDAAEAGDLDAYRAAVDEHYRPLKQIIAQELQGHE